jgi:hypothetical protein
MDFPTVQVNENALLRTHSGHYPRRSEPVLGFDARQRLDLAATDDVKDESATWIGSFRQRVGHAAAGSILHLWPEPAGPV